MKVILKKLNYMLNQKQKRRIALLICMMIIGAFFETLGVGLIVPLVTTIMSADNMFEKQVVKNIYQIAGMDSSEEFVVWIMGSLILIYIIKNI